MIRVYGAPERIAASATVSRLRQEPLGCAIVDRAVIPLCREVEVETYDETDAETFTGWKAGVYDRDGRVCELSLMDRHWTRLTVPFEPGEIDPGAAYGSSEEVVYGGLLFHHFGRFLLETTNRLWWPLTERFEGRIVFQNTLPGQRLPPFASRFFELLGLLDRVVIATQPLAFDRVVVPERSFAIQRSIHPAFRLPFLTAGAAAQDQAAPDDRRPSDGRGLYLSRTRFPKRRSFGERRIEALFARHGFAVLHTEELSLDQQILAVRGHERIAGIAGSAFHNLLFAQAERTPCYICRDYDINPNFFMIDELMGNDASYLYNLDEAFAATPRSAREIVATYWDDADLDVRKIRRLLARSGTIRDDD